MSFVRVVTRSIPRSSFPSSRPVARKYATTVPPRASATPQTRVPIPPLPPPTPPKDERSMIPIWAGVTVVIASFGYYMFAGDAIDTYPGKAKGMAQEAEGTVKGMMNQAEGKASELVGKAKGQYDEAVGEVKKQMK